MMQLQMECYVVVQELAAIIVTRRMVGGAPEGGAERRPWVMLDSNISMESFCGLKSIVVEGSVEIPESVVKLLFSILGPNLTLLCDHSPAALVRGTGLECATLWWGTFISHLHNTRALYYPTTLRMFSFSLTNG